MCQYERGDARIYIEGEGEQREDQNRKKKKEKQRLCPEKVRGRRRKGGGEREKDRLHSI